MTCEQNADICTPAVEVDIEAIRARYLMRGELPAAVAEEVLSQSEKDAIALLAAIDCLQKESGAVPQNRAVSGLSELARTIYEEIVGLFLTVSPQERAQLVRVVGYVLAALEDAEERCGG